MAMKKWGAGLCLSGAGRGTLPERSPVELSPFSVVGQFVPLAVQTCPNSHCEGEKSKSQEEERRAREPIQSWPRSLASLVAPSLLLPWQWP